jgi:hypothetical protein
MIRAFTTLLAAALLTACGGSTSDEDLATSPGLQAQASAWVNAMPTLIDPGQPPACNNLIISFSVQGRSAALPKPARVAAVSVKKQGQVIWTGPASAAETGQGEDGVLRGVARGCPPSGLAEKDALDIVVRVQTASGSGEAATPVVLGFAY